MSFSASKTVRNVLAGLLIAVGGASAHAVPLFTLNFDEESITSNNQLTGASAEIGFTFDDEGADVRVTLEIANTTDVTTFGAGATESKLTGFGFDLLVGVAFGGDFTTTGFLDTVIENAKFKPFDRLDLAFADNGNFNGGNPRNALPEGQTEIVTFLLDTDLSAATLGDAYLQAFLVDDTARAGLRFQDVNAGKGSDKLIYVGRAAVPPGGGPGVASVPVPASLPLFAAALVGLALLSRQRRRR